MLVTCIASDQDLSHVYVTNMLHNNEMKIFFYKLPNIRNGWCIDNDIWFDFIVNHISC